MHLPRPSTSPHASDRHEFTAGRGKAPTSSCCTASVTPRSDGSGLPRPSPTATSSPSTSWATSATANPMSVSRPQPTTAVGSTTQSTRWTSPRRTSPECRSAATSQLSHAVQGGTAGSLVLFDPVGLVELRMARFIAWGAGTALAAMAPQPIRRWAGRRLRQPILDDKADVRAYLKGSIGHPMTLPPLPVFTDEQLASITVPVRVVAGAKSPPFDGAAMIRRVQDSIKHPAHPPPP